METVIRIGEKNNFNHTEAEYAELEKYSKKGKLFVNSNSFTKIKSILPSFVTINPYMYFTEPKGDLSNVKAFRIKLWDTDSIRWKVQQIKALQYADKMGIPVLITFMRFKARKTLEKYKTLESSYKHSSSYFRPIKSTQKKLKKFAKLYSKKVFVCDEKGIGCKACLNCTKLTYGIKSDVTIKALNLSISGIDDRYGRKGICAYKCPDCFAKIVTFGKRPACDRLITNLKLQGKIKHI